MNRISYLDGLRGIAALIVVLSHFLYAFYPALETGAISEIHTQSQAESWIATSPLNLFYSGNFAVCIFFVLSGFVLTFGFFKTQNYELIYSVALKRYLRLQIPILFTILLTYAMMKCSLFCNQKIVQVTQSTWWLGRCWNFEPNFFEALAQSFFYVLFDPTNSRDLYVGVMWTMPYEFVGSYLVFGIAALSAGKSKRFYFYGVLALLFINSYFLAFILGMILADLSCSKRIQAKNRWTKSVILFFGLLFGSYPSVVAPGTFYDWATIPFILHNESFYHIMGAVLLFIFLHNSNFFQKILSLQFPQFLGKISFSMYLVHTLVIGSTASYLFHVLSEQVSYFTASILTIALNFLVILFFSVIMYRLIDVRAMQFSKFIYDYFAQKILKPKSYTKTT